MPTFMLADHPCLPWVDDADELTADAIEVMSGYGFLLDESEHDRVMLVDE